MNSNRPSNLSLMVELMLLNVGFLISCIGRCLLNLKVDNAYTLQR